MPLAIVAPVGNLIAFNFLLSGVIDTGGMSYAQYVLPVIVIQAVFLGALTTVERAATDQRTEFGKRLGTMPISTVSPLMARMLYCLMRGALSLLAALAVGYAFGFRISGGLGYVLAFTVLTLMFTLALSLAADAAGSSVATAAASQLFVAPQMLLVVLSTGLAPLDSFPDWVHPFVRDQPVSQVTEALRGFAGGHVVASNLIASVAWCAGLFLVFGTLAIRMQRRTE
ncbi:ABC transporter permease [Mycolicibacterium rhodesiae]|uniref:ABC transporter permease n=1 Tax=Mycolicibacterium rhodesiae TaxID=36814 RepID=UPI0027E3B25B|nr:ABC transporter permease [Mycolicibacterium rhodesiae]